MEYIYTCMAGVYAFYGLREEEDSKKLTGKQKQEAGSGEKQSPEVEKEPEQLAAGSDGYCRRCCFAGREDDHRRKAGPRLIRCTGGVAAAIRVGSSRFSFLFVMYVAAAEGRKPLSGC